jgi:uncharacterized membrane protein YgcG
VQPAYSAIVQMKCPSCATPLQAPPDRCPKCKLSLQRLDMKFGMVPRHSRFLTDRTGRIPMSEIEQLRAALRLFEKKFPQILFSIFVDDLHAGTSVSEYAFWLANRARFSSLEKKHGENFDLLLVIDHATRSASLTTGYGLEDHVSEHDLQLVLDELAGPLREGNVAAGIHALLEALIRLLRVRSRDARNAEPQTAEVLADAP